MLVFLFFFFKQKTAYEMRISDWSLDVCSSDLKPASRWWLHIGRHFDMPLPGRRGGQHRQQPGVGHTQQYAEAEAADERRRRTRKQAEREQRHQARQRDRQ